MTVNRYLPEEPASVSVVGPRPSIPEAVSVCWFETPKDNPEANSLKWASIHEDALRKVPD